MTGLSGVDWLSDVVTAASEGFWLAFSEDPSARASTASRRPKSAASARGIRSAFVKRCQNFSDDGGFFLTPVNPAQNKAGMAGVAGEDGHGGLRYHSYGSATADGLRALVRCGLAPGHPRVVAARAWLERNFSTRTNPGVFEGVLAADRDAAYHYYCWSVTHAFRMLGVSTIRQQGRQVGWAALLAEELLGRQRADGSWQNPYRFMKEDDPLIATALAAAALANCRQMMWPR